MPRKSDVVIAQGNRSDFRLRSINDKDLESLRVWKNHNSASFFLKEEITPEQQSLWYEAFCDRDNDYMFIVEQKVGNDWKEIGCMGFRKLEAEGCIDAYNIMRFRKIEPVSFSMSEAFVLMLAFAEYKYIGLPIRCKVLRDNPAVKWYEKNNFKVTTWMENYYLLELTKETLNDLDFEIRNI